MTWSLQLLFATLLLLNCSDTRQAADNRVLTDSVVLFKKDSAFTAGEVPALIKCNLVKKPFTVSTEDNSRILLMLDNPVLTAPAEGVYEVYVTGVQQDVTMLAADQKSFAGLLDLYSLTAPGVKQQLELDITEKVNPLFYQQKAYPVFYIYIRLTTVQDANKKNVPNPGSLHFSSAAILQVKN